MTKAKILNIGLVLASLIGYTEWGNNQSLFVFQEELSIIEKLFTNPSNTVHPFTVLPLLGQLLLIITLFQSKVNKVLTYIGIGCISILFLMFLIIGIISFNAMVTGFSLPFIVLAYITIKHHRKTSIQ